MSVRRRRASLFAVATAGVLSLAAALSGASPAAAQPLYDQDLVNRLDGGRLALDRDGRERNADAITLRDPQGSARTESWDVDLTEDDEGGWYAIIRNRETGQCLQPGREVPARGVPATVSDCDGSARQTWRLTPADRRDPEAGWYLWRPLTNEDLALSVDRFHGGAWDSLHLDTAYPSDDRLWRLGPNDRPWEIN
ncbi:RICIN domain-containing protein [Streptomyces litchfieldiae]|uniref:Ricin B lectin domain-containing protein n=1 Tax=Streptomyces litchfieldiae TaxID=3075543 RepID=A0ABU2MUR4_9ACTN|nr:RICIN domain-containing protein [Streptomyces sp. DSM 44938]MDT0345364.1 hypothetical protein [Streptomyces sp. DSM 44938]